MKQFMITISDIQELVHVKDGAFCDSSKRLECFYAHRVQKYFIYQCNRRIDNNDSNNNNDNNSSNNK